MTYSFATWATRKATLAVLASLLSSFAIYGQTPSCTAASNTVLVHQEGLAERIGDINLTCAGGPALGNISATLFVSLNTNMTNRLDADGNPLGITITANTGGGATATGRIRLAGPATLSISALNYTVPAIPATPVNIAISGLRAAVASLSNGSAPSIVTATLVSTGFSAATSQLVTAISAASLLQSSINNGVPCNGSPLPSPLDFSTFSTTSISSTVRFTEASPTAFVPKKIGDDSGVRILVNLTGYGTGARVFAPDAIVGNNGATPTSAGAFGSAAAAGTYAPGANQLLLIRVNGADRYGAGGTLALAQPLAATTFTSMSEITVNQGYAYAVYEVVDSNTSIVETAQIPAFVAVPAVNCPSTLNPVIVADLAPVSTVSVATASDPLPRFVSTPAASDCQQLNDCEASYLPGLSVDTSPIRLTGSSLGAKQSAFVRVGNTGAGKLGFTTAFDYQSGANWLTASPSSGVNNATLQVIADPAMLQPGTYTATMTVSAGSYGSGVVPVTFTVGQPGVTINNVGNAASFVYGSVAPGSYAVLYGANLSGKNVSVTFNGVSATIVYAGAGQINLLVPKVLAGQAGARVVVTVDGVPSNPFTLSLTSNAPGIFNPGIVNAADGTVNGADHPATRGSLISVYLTGLSVPVAGLTVNIGDQKGLIPAFAGEQPTFPGLDQVNITVPPALTTVNGPSVPVQVCVPGLNQPVCSNSVDLYLR